MIATGVLRHGGRVAALCFVLLLAFALRVHAGEGATVPNFELKDIDGNTFRLADHLGRGPIVIDFWATWCKPCLRQMPHLEALRKKYESRQLLVVAISVDESRSSSKVKSYVKTHGYGFRVPLDPNQDVFRKLGGRAMPHQVIVAPDGSRIAVHTGYREGDERELERHITEALAALGPSPGDPEARPTEPDTVRAGEPR